MPTWESFSFALVLMESFNVLGMKAKRSLNIIYMLFGNLEKSVLGKFYIKAHLINLWLFIKTKELRNSDLNIFSKVSNKKIIKLI